MRRKRILSQKRPAAGGEARERASFLFWEGFFMVKISSRGGYFTFEISPRLQRVQSGGQIICFYKPRFSTIFFNAARTGESSGRRTVGFPSQSYS
mgnify:CR=1 FL=1